MNVTKKYLSEQFKMLVDEANDILKEIKNDKTSQKAIEKNFGGILSDQSIMTKQGKFRKNPSKMNKEQLEHMITILKDFLDSKSEAEKLDKDTKELARRLGVRQENAYKVLSLMEIAKQHINEGLLSSHQLRDMINARVEALQSTTEITKALLQAIKNSNQDIDKFVAEFSENGRLI